MLYLVPLSMSVIQTHSFSCNNRYVTSCSTDATNVEDIQLFPEKVVTQINCSDLSPVTPMFLFVLPRSSQVS
jgi:hypothetical protein